MRYKFLNHCRSNIKRDKGVKSQIYIKIKFLSKRRGWGKSSNRHWGFWSVLQQMVVDFLKEDHRRKNEFENVINSFWTCEFWCVCESHPGRSWTPESVRQEKRQAWEDRHLCLPCAGDGKLSHYDSVSAPKINQGQMPGERILCLVWSHNIAVCFLLTWPLTFAHNPHLPSTTLPIHLFYELRLLETLHVTQLLIHLPLELWKIESLPEKKNENKALMI